MKTIYSGKRREREREENPVHTDVWFEGCEPNLGKRRRNIFRRGKPPPGKRSTHQNPQETGEQASKPERPPKEPRRSGAEGKREKEDGAAGAQSGNERNERKSHGVGERSCKPKAWRSGELRAELPGPKAL